MIIDNAPLQREAWEEYRAARQRHDRAARDLHRHEQVDAPEYELWLHRTFPVEISTLRNLHEAVFSKGRQVESVRVLAGLTGRPPHKLWREQKAYEADPEAFQREFGDFFEKRPGDTAENDEEEDFFHHAKSGADGWQERGNPFERPSAPRVSAAFSREAKAIYRRLVQYLHPDRGGEFTVVRKRLWHEVQQAWAERDTDWLARIEVEWENANEVLSPLSSLGRLRRAVEELHSARRDTEKKLRAYRRSQPWRFSMNRGKKRDVLHRETAANFQHDITFLQRQLEFLQNTIEAWERRLRRRAG